MSEASVAGERGPTWSLLDVLAPAGDYLTAAGVENGRYDAELMLADILKLSRLDLYLQYERLLTDMERGAFRHMLKQRRRRIPLQHILGEVEFFNSTFKVRPGVFIPRQETEILVEKILAVLDEAFPAGDPTLAGGPLRALEMGVGSGVIAISLTVARTDLVVWASDISPASLKLTGENAQLNDVGMRVSLEERSGLPLGNGAPAHLIVSNPPYIRLDEKDTLQPEVLDHDPHEALFGGEEGLTFYRQLADEVPARLLPGGILALEIGADQGPAVTELLTETGFIDIKIHQDYAGHDRVVIARRPA